MSKVNPTDGAETKANGAKPAVLTVLLLYKDPKSSDLCCKNGTGFVFHSDDDGSLVLTANHVIGNWGTGDLLYVRRKVPGGGVEQLGAGVLHEDPIADVAVLCVPELKNHHCLAFTSAVVNGESIIAVGHADPDHLFPEIACKRDPDLSPGSYAGMNLAGWHYLAVSNLHLELVSCKGMSGCPVLSATAVIGMLTAGQGAYTTLVSSHTICEVLKKFYLKTYYQTQFGKAYRLTPEQIAVVEGMNMEEIIALF